MKKKIFVCGSRTISDINWIFSTEILAIIENEMHLDALSNSVFFFCNKSHKLLKIIFWNKTGFWRAHEEIKFDSVF